MFGLGWAEMMLAAIVALIVIGPKELPGLFRKVGQFVGKAKGMARDFSKAMNDAADDAGVNDIRGSFDDIKGGVQMATDPTTKWKDYVPGSETAKLAEDRAADAKAMHDGMAAKAQERLDAVKAANAAASDVDTAIAKPKPAAKKAVANKPVSKKTAAKQPSAKKTADAPKVAKPAAAKKPAAQKTAAPKKKPAAKS